MSISPINTQSVSNNPSQNPISATGNPITQTQNNNSVTPDLAIAVPSPEQLKQAAEMLNQSDSFKRTSINFQVDEANGQLVIKVMDTEKNEVIRQIPSVEALELSRAMASNAGSLVKTQS